MREEQKTPVQKAPVSDFKIIGNWAKQSTELKEQFSNLTDADLKFEPGKENELLTRVEKRLDKNREEVIGIFNSVK